MELLSVRGISKYFRETAILANDRVSLSLESGETRAVVGENGAGKSTLARVIAGLVAQDLGQVLVRGRRIKPGSVREAETAGIGFVPQFSLLAEDLSVAENIVLGREPRTMGLFLSKRKAYVETAMLAERFGFRLDPDALVSSLSAAERRQADIAKALARGGEILVLDEPTSILSETESAGLFELLARLAKAGKAILLISHRLTEVLKVADSITVLREGRVAAELPTEGADEARLSGLMARNGYAPGSRGSIASVRHAGPPALELRGVPLARDARPISLVVGSGEVLAVTALAGNGLRRLEDYASGTETPPEGAVLVEGKELSSRGRAALRSLSLGYVPSDREKRGLVLAAAMRDNILALRRSEFSVRDWVGRKRRNAAAREAAAPFGLVADPRQSAASLSGGNRQRLVLARELDRPRAAFVLAEALQSLDLSSQTEMTTLIRKLAARGAGVLLLLSSVEEAIASADRVIALYRGEIAWEGPNEGASTAAMLIAAMTGGGLSRASSA